MPTESEYADGKKFPRIKFLLDSDGDKILDDQEPAIISLTDSTGGTAGSDTLAALVNLAALTDSTTGTPNDVLAALTQLATLADNSGGAAGSTIIATLGRVLHTHFVSDMSKFTVNDVITDYKPGFAGRFLALDWITGVIPASTASKDATLVGHIESTIVTDSALALTTAGCDTIGKVVYGAVHSAAMEFTAAETISVLCTVSAADFVEGEGTIVLALQNDDMMDAIATLVAEQAKQITWNASNRNSIATIARELALQKTLNTVLTGSLSSLSDKIQEIIVALRNLNLIDT